MQQIELELAGGGVLTVSLRASLDAMPAVKERPLVLVVPGGGYSHVSPREGDPVALQFAAAGYHTAVLTYSVGEGAQNASCSPTAERSAGSAAAECGRVAHPAG